MNTVVGFSNDHAACVFVSAEIKREVIRYLKSKITSANFAPLFFSILVFLLIKEEKFNYVLIDEEYTGKDEYISETIKRFFEFSKKRCPEIVFGRIGKHSKAHTLSLKVHRAKGRGVIKIGFRQIVRLFSEKTAGTKRHTHRVSR